MLIVTFLLFFVLFCGSACCDDFWLHVCYIMYLFSVGCLC